MSWLLVLGAWSFSFSATAAEFTQSDATTAMHRAVVFFRTKVGYHGAYGYAVSDDLSKREGENRITA
ncbi:MAG: hypothetical protein JNK76_15015, partial [Planctomycetales bacterium]|nr:hypothetical protein [Planctomycetales bacterium]